MPTVRNKRIALAQLFVVGCAVVFGAAVPAEHAQAQAQQFVPPPPPPVPAPPPPVFNPPSPNRIVPQPSYTPVSPATPSAAPGYDITSPVDGRLPPPATRSHERTTAAKTVRHRGRSVVARATPRPYSSSYYYPAFDYDYGCAWRRAWDGYWFRTSPCS